MNVVLQDNAIMAGAAGPFPVQIMPHRVSEIEQAGIGLFLVCAIGWSVQEVRQFPSYPSGS